METAHLRRLSRTQRLVAWGIAALLIVGVIVASIWLGGVDISSAEQRIHDGRARPADFAALCEDAIKLKSREGGAWIGATPSHEPAHIYRSKPPQEIGCMAIWPDGSTVSFQARVFCADGTDCVNVM